MTSTRLLGILAIVVQIVNGLLALGTVIPLKYAAIVGVLVGVAQGFLPRAQGSSATAKGE